MLGEKWGDENTTKMGMAKVHYEEGGGIKGEIISSHPPFAQ